MMELDDYILKKTRDGKEVKIIITPMEIREHGEEFDMIIDDKYKFDDIPTEMFDDWDLEDAEDVSSKTKKVKND